MSSQLIYFNIAQLSHHGRVAVRTKMRNYNYITYNLCILVKLYKMPVFLFYSPLPTNLGNVHNECSVVLDLQHFLTSEFDYVGLPILAESNRMTAVQSQVSQELNSQLPNQTNCRMGYFII